MADKRSAAAEADGAPLQKKADNTVAVEVAAHERQVLSDRVGQALESAWAKLGCGSDEVLRQLKEEVLASLTKNEAVGHFSHVMTLELGDMSCTGNENGSDQRFVANHGVTAIQDAYHTSSEKLGFDLMKENYMEEKDAEQLRELGFMAGKQWEDFKAEEFALGSLDYDVILDLWLRLARESLPDLVWAKAEGGQWSQVGGSFLFS
uniref:Uncharacterized protein n=1 Tax=Noctiluca scintillans TaxID=2966 RepID=A0A7S1A5F6_NOCSC